MKFKNNIYGFISFKHIILLLLFGYIFWLISVFYNTIIGIDKMYTDSYTKQLDEKKKIEEVIKIKTDEKQLFEEQEAQRILKEQEIREKKLKENAVKKQEIENKEVNSSKNTSSSIQILDNTYIDPVSDDSIKKFVTSNKSFNNKKYIPKNLVTISSKYVIDTKGTQVLRKVANDNLQAMAEQFFKDTGEKIVVVSAYRSYEYQKGIKDRGCPDNLCAKAGYSEHQSGLAVDLWDASTNYEWKNSTKLQNYYKWLSENAYKYGFHNTYQKGLKVDGYEIEPWHWRYVGIELASYLRNSNLTLAQYYK